MANLYFYYSSMDAGKTTQLIQTAHNYQQRKMKPLVLKPSTDNREGTKPRVISRIGLEFPATIVDVNDIDMMDTLVNGIVASGYDVVLVDEVQFFSVEHLKRFVRLVDEYGIPVLCYGLRNSFNNEGFPSVMYLLQHAEKLVEVKTMCWCGSKATHNLMVVDGIPIKSAQSAVKVGGSDLYHSVCRKHFNEGRYQ